MDWEINLGGIRIKSGFIFVFMAFASTVAGGVWTAGELYNRLVALEGQVEEIPDVAPIEERLSLLEKSVTDLDTGKLDLRIERIETRIEDQDLSALQGNLAVLKTNLENLMAGQGELKDFAKNVEENKRLVEQTRADMARFQQDMDDVWTALDELTY